MGQDELEVFLSRAQAQLIRSNADHKHPFRYVTLATSKDHQIKQRTVVHRKFVAPNISHICTDSRTAKIDQIHVNPEVSLLFYNPKTRLQISVQATAQIISEGEIYDFYRRNISEHQWIDYAAVPSPGQEISTQDAYQSGKQLHINVVVLHWKFIDILRLDRSGNSRAQFSFDAESWQGTWVVP